VIATPEPRRNGAGASVSGTSGGDAAAAAPAPALVRSILVVGYLGFVLAGIATPWAPRVFWTMLLPLLVLAIVIAGFHRWRAVCPLATLGSVGHRIASDAERRVPDWLERWHLLLPFALLVTMLLVRLVATNGDGRWLAGLLLLLALTAIGVNARFTGKTWCNFVCPVGFVERLYTDSGTLVRGGRSQCERCTACKKSCPDIDQENNYWRELGAGGRRLATYAFPGVVLAFYGYFFLRAGDWEAYFDGRWTRQPVTRELLSGAGFYFAPRVPAIAAAALTLLLGALVSLALFAAVDRLTRRRIADAERQRHLVLSLAAFTAFSLFYVFAGAPTLRRIPYGTRSFAFLAPAVATLVLARRWGRTRGAYIRDKGAAKLLKHWPFAGEPPADPLEAYTRAQASEQAREQLLAGYAQTLRDVVADGLVDETEWKLLDELRRQFGITPREHERVAAQLAEDERGLLASGRVATVEQRLQLETYGAALTEALVAGAPDGEIDALRRSFGVDPGDHLRLVTRLRSGTGPLVERARRDLAEASSRRGDRLAIAAGAPAGESRELLVFLLSRCEEAAVGRALDRLAPLGDDDAGSSLRRSLASSDPAVRQAALQRFREAAPAAGELGAELAALLAPPDARGADGADADAVLAHLATDPDPFVRAAATWVLAAGGSESARSALAAARADADPLVRESAGAAPAAGGFAALPRIVRMQALRRVPIFAELDADDLLDLTELATERSIAAGGALCVEGQADSGDLFVVLDGTASVSRKDDGGSESEIARLGAGEVVGELALLDGSPRSATVRALDGPLRVLTVPAAAFRERLLPRGRVARALLVTLTGRLRAVSGRLTGRASAAPR